MAAFPKTYNFPQGQKSLPFSAEEYTNRINGLRQIMHDHDLGVVVLTSPHNIAYYVGLQYRPFGRPYALVVTGQDCVTVCPAIEAGRPSRRCYGDTLIYTDWERSDFHRAVRSIAGIGRIVGYEADQLSVVQAQALRHHLHPTGLIDVSVDTVRQRMILSDAERVLIRDGVASSERAISAMRDVIKPGVREIDVAMAGTDALMGAVAAHFPQAEYRDSWVQCQSGVNTDAAYHPPTARTLETGDILTLIAQPLIQGYGAPVARTAFLGAPDQETLTTWEAQGDALAYAKTLIVPGTSCAEIAAELATCYEKLDLLRYSPAGFGQALGVLPHLQSGGALDLRPDNDVVLLPGMGIALAPMLSVPIDQPGGGGYCDQDIVFVTDGGCANVSTLPAGPPENVIAV